MRQWIRITTPWGAISYVVGQAQDVTRSLVDLSLEDSRIQVLRTLG